VTSFSLHIIGGAGAGQRHPITATTIIGRQTSGGIAIDDPQLSRQHARFDPAPNGLTVTDLGSANGTLVNERRITGPTPLYLGDVVQLGDCMLRVEGSPAPSLAPALGQGVPTPVPYQNATPPHAKNRRLLMAGGLVGVLLLLCVCGVGALVIASRNDDTTGQVSSGNNGGDGGGSGVAQGSGAGLPQGIYACGHLSSTGSNQFYPDLQILSATRYRDTDAEGDYSYDPSTHQITWRSGALANPGWIGIYNPPGADGNTNHQILIRKQEDVNAGNKGYIQACNIK
jgi:hypothetical protein